MHSPSRFLTLLVLCASALAGGCDDAQSQQQNTSTLPPPDFSQPNTSDASTQDTSSTPDTNTSPDSPSPIPNNTFSLPSTDTLLALPLGFDALDHTGSPIATFSDPDQKIFGYIIRHPNGTSVQQADAAIQTAFHLSENRRTIAFAQPTTTWIGRFAGLSGDTAHITKGSFRYGTPPNDHLTAFDAASLRSALLTSFSPHTVTSKPSRPCQTLTAYNLTEARNAAFTLSIGAIVCDDDLQLPPINTFLDDLLTGTQHAPLSSSFNTIPLHTFNVPGRPSTSSCDFLWVVDNSGSMADEQLNLAVTASEFMSVLNSSLADWRVGVTTTDTYCMGLDRNDPNLNPLYQLCLSPNGTTPGTIHDPIFDFCTGLRGFDGFLSPNTPNAPTLFEERVTKNANCTSPQGAAPDSNVCGFGLESGLSSTSWIIPNLLLDDHGPSCTHTNTPNHRLRADPNAQTIIVWLSDEEDDRVKVDSIPLPPNDPARLAITSDIQNTFSQIATDNGLNLTFHAIVGDEGISNGGICQPLPPGALQGAEHGLAYIDIAHATGGAVGSICNPNLTTTIDSIVRDCIANVASVPLPPPPSDTPLGAPPVLSTLRVFLNDQEISHTNDGSNPYWTYSSQHNALTFFRLPLPPDSQLSIAYNTWTPAP